MTFVVSAPHGHLGSPFFPNQRTERTCYPSLRIARLASLPCDYSAGRSCAAMGALFFHARNSVRHFCRPRAKPSSYTLCIFAFCICRNLSSQFTSSAPIQSLQLTSGGGCASGVGHGQSQIGPSKVHFPSSRSIFEPQSQVCIFTFDRLLR